MGYLDHSWAHKFRLSLRSRIGGTFLRRQDLGSRRAKSPEVTEGGGARRGSVARGRDQASGRRPHPAELIAGVPRRAQVPPAARSDVLVQVDVPERPRRVPLRLFEELVELAVEDVLLGFFGLDGGGKFLLPLDVVGLQGADRLV